MSFHAIFLFVAFRSSSYANLRDLIEEIHLPPLHNSLNVGGSYMRAIHSAYSKSFNDFIGIFSAPRPGIKISSVI